MTHAVWTVPTSSRPDPTIRVLAAETAFLKEVARFDMPTNANRFRRKGEIDDNGKVETCRFDGH